MENVTFIREMSFADYLIIKRATKKSTQSLKFFLKGELEFHFFLVMHISPYYLQELELRIRLIPDIRMNPNSLRISVF